MFNEHILNEWMKPSTATLAHHAFVTDSTKSFVYGLRQYMMGRHVLWLPLLLCKVTVSWEEFCCQKTLAVAAAPPLGSLTVWSWASLLTSKCNSLWGLNERVDMVHRMSQMEGASGHLTIYFILTHQANERIGTESKSPKARFGV